MPSLAEVFVTVKPDIGNFDKDVRSRLSKIDGADAGKKVGGRFGAAFQGAAKGMLAGAALLSGLSAATGFLKEANAEARESQKVGATTAQIIKATGGAAKISADQVGALATSLSNKTGMDDEAIQSGSNLLLTFKNVRNEAGEGANVFDRATASAVDLSAAGFGSVSGASKMLGKALNDPLKGISALSRAGVTFTDQQKEQIKTLVASGDTLGAQKIILAEVEGQVGGVAAASATMGEKLSVSFGNFKEQIGTALLPIVDKVAGVLHERVIPAVSGFVKGMTDGTGAGGRFADILKGVGSFVMDTVVPAFRSFGVFVGRVVDAFRNADVGGGIGGFVGRVGAALSAVGTTIGPILLRAGKALVAWIAPQIGPALEAIGGWLASLGKWFVGTALPAIGRFLVGVGTKLYDWIAPQIGPALRQLGGWLAELGKWFVGTAVPWLVAKAQELGSALIGWVKPRIPGLLADLGGFIGSAVGWITGTGIPWLARTVAKLGVALVGWVVDNGPTILLRLGTFFADVVTWIVTKGIPLLVRGLIGLGKALLDAFVGAIKGAIGGFRSEITNTDFGAMVTTIPTKILTGLGNTALWLVQKGKDLITGFITGITSMFESLATTVGNLWKSIKGVFDKGESDVETSQDTFFGNLLTKATSGLANVLSGAIGPGLKNIKDRFTADQGTLETNYGTHWANLNTTARTEMPKLNTTAGTNWGTLNRTFDSNEAAVELDYSQHWTDLNAKARTEMPKLNSTAVSNWGTIKSTFNTNQAAVDRSFSSFWTAQENEARTSMNTIVTSTSAGGTRLVSTVRGFVDRAGDEMDKIRNRFKSPVDYVMSNAFGRIRSAYNAVAGTVSMAKIPAFSGGGSPSQPSTPKAPAFDPRNLRAGGLAALAVGGGVLRGPGGPRADKILGLDRRTKTPTAWVSNREFVVNAKSYENNKGLVEAINAAHGPLRELRERRDGGVIPRLFLGGRSPLSGASWKRHAGYSWARWAGDGNAPNDFKKPIGAWKAGKVASVRAMTTSYGKHVRVNHSGEETLYAHLDSFAVKVGQALKAGQMLGRLGDTGNSSGPHIHFELKGGNSPLGDTSGDGAASPPIVLRPREMYRSAAGNPALALGAGQYPWARVLRALVAKADAGAHNKLPASYTVPGSGSAGSSASSSSGDGPRAAAARKYINATWPQIRTIYGFVKKNIAGTNTPSKHSMGKALDLMTSNKALGNEIANYFAGSGRGRFGVDNVIWNRRIHNARGWHGYNGSNPHTDHVHVDFFKDGGLVPQLAGGGIVQGGRGGTVARIGEGVRDELVTPLPRGWKTDRRDGSSDVAELVALLKAGRLGNEFHFTTYNPVVEAQSVTTNRALQRVGSLDLV